jgi:phenylalanine-4-hydroxylase
VRRELKGFFAWRVIALKKWRWLIVDRWYTIEYGIKQNQKKVDIFLSKLYI